MVGLYAAAALAGGLGWGDVKLAGLLGLVLGQAGLGQLLVGATAGFVLAGLAGGMIMLVRHTNPATTSLAFAPWMTLGAGIGLGIGA
jgi:leader peptidase (prepilin peptidase)/N-methyltransferase